MDMMKTLSTDMRFETSNANCSKSNHSFGTGPPVPDRAYLELSMSISPVSGYAFASEISFAKGISHDPTFKKNIKFSKTKNNARW